MGLRNIGARNTLRLLSTPLVLLLLCVLCYGLLIPGLGYYWDDWLGVWVGRVLGPDGLREYTSCDRPAQGWLMSISVPVVGQQPYRWHVFALIARWLGALGVWAILRGTWPDRRQEAAAVALLFAVYPGMILQPVAWIMLQGGLLTLALFMLSLAAMLWAVRAPRLFWPLSVFAVLAGAANMAVGELYVGLELLRPLLLWALLKPSLPDWRPRIRRVLVRWAPYAIVLVGYLVWRLLLFKSVRADTDQWVYLGALTAHPLGEFKVRLLFVASDLIESCLMAWALAFRPAPFFDFGWGAMWKVVWAASAVGAAVVVPYLHSARSRDPLPTDPAQDQGLAWARQAVWIGLLATALGGVAFWAVKRHVLLDNARSYYTLSMMFGACLLLVGLLRLLLRTSAQRVAVVAMLVAASIGSHIHNADGFRRDWQAQQSLIRQLSWRAPGLQPGTTVLVAPSNLKLVMDYTLAAPLNLTYAPEHASWHPKYWAFPLGPGHTDVLAEAHKQGQFKRTIRSVSFTGPISRSLVVWLSPSGTLRMLDPSAEVLPNLLPLQPYSNLDCIVTNPTVDAKPPCDIFGPEPAHDWTYHFQKADLARQQGLWSEVAQKGDEARHAKLAPSDTTEWLPFVEGYARVGRLKDAGELAIRILESGPVGQLMVRRFVDRLARDDSTDKGMAAFLDGLRKRISAL